MIVLQRIDIGRAVSGEPGVEAAFELAVDGDDQLVVKGHDLGEERAGDLLHRVKPEVAVEQARRAEALFSV
jgi:hypothetical protein